MGVRAAGKEGALCLPTRPGGDEPLGDFCVLHGGSFRLTSGALGVRATRGGEVQGARLQLLPREPPWPAGLVQAQAPVGLFIITELML